MPVITLQQFDNLLKNRLSNVLTKDDGKRFATKDDLKNFVTKDDLKNFATKDDLKNFATKDDLRRELKRYVTKDDLKQLEKNIEHKIDNAVSDIIEVVDKTKADKKQVDDLDKRVEVVEEKVAILST